MLFFLWASPGHLGMGAEKRGMARMKIPKDGIVNKLSVRGCGKSTPTKNIYICSVHTMGRMCRKKEYESAIEVEKFYYLHSRSISG